MRHAKLDCVVVSERRTEVSHFAIVAGGGCCLAEDTIYLWCCRLRPVPCGELHCRKSEMQGPEVWAGRLEGMERLWPCGRAAMQNWRTVFSRAVGFSLRYARHLRHLSAQSRRYLQTKWVCPSVTLAHLEQTQVASVVDPLAASAASGNANVFVSALTSIARSPSGNFPFGCFCRPFSVYFL